MTQPNNISSLTNSSKPDKRAFITEFTLLCGFEPTEGQHNAILAITDFLLSTDSLRIFLLGGYAGTGKTSLIAALVKALKKFKLKSVLMAPTGRAAKVMSGYSGTKASTVHRRIYVFSKDGTGANRYKLMENKLKNTVFIVDEASMIQGVERREGRGLLDDLIEFVYSGENCRLIFVGDVGQLPPIGMDFSPALNKKFLLDACGFETDTALLSEIVRQESGSGILIVSSRLRKFVPEIPLLHLHGRDAAVLDSSELQEAIESAYSESGRDDVMIVCRSNKQANAYNRQIRNRILWHDEELNAGDILMALTNNYFWLDEKSDAGFIANGQMMEMMKLVREESKYGLRFADAIVRFPDYPEMPEQEIKLILDSLYVDAPSLPTEKMHDLYNHIAVEEYSEAANRRELSRLVMQNQYYQAIQVKFGYAVTCNKAQGGQWDTVFVDPGYFLPEMWDRNYMRWLYTAVTRAKRRLKLVNLYPGFSQKSD